MRNTEEKKPRGLRFTLFTYFLLFSLLILVLLWVFQILFLDRFYAAITETRMEKAALDIVRMADSDDLYETVEAVSRKNSACINVYSVEDRQAICLCSVDTEVGCVIHVLSQHQLNALYKSTHAMGGTYSAAYALIEGDGFRFADEMEEETEGKIIDERKVYAHLFHTPDKGEIFVLLDCSLTPIEATINVLAVQLGALSVILLLISFLLAYFISRRISEPLSFLNIAARRLPSGRYPEQYRETGYREVAELSQTLSEAALEIGKVDKMKKELIANISHDLRTPLTMIIGYAEVMRDMPDENSSENMQIIINEAHRLSSMVEDLVSISRYEGNADEVKKERFSLSEELVAMCEEYRSLLSGRGYTVEAEIEEGLFAVADRRRIIQTLRNLINNAVNYSGEDKTVLLRLFKTEEPWLRFEVEDHGEGIAKEDIPHIWERYYRVDKEHVRSIVGSGLGLSIVQKNLELHGARYGVESTLGKGSVFWFELPLDK